MSYAEFKKAYIDAFNRMMAYSCDQAGSVDYAEEMAKLADDYPEYEARLYAELED